jgi:hypothetical protein
MFNTRRVLGLVLVAATAFPACTSKKGLGRKSVDAGRDAQPDSGCAFMDPGSDPCALAPPDGSLDRAADGSLDRAADGSLDRAADGSPDRVADGSPDRVADGSPDGARDVRSVCSLGSDQDCNDSPASALWGICQADGTCTCINGSFTNPSTGKCMRPEVTGCTGSYKACGCGCCAAVTPVAVCYYPSAGDSLSAIRAADEATRTSPACQTAGCSLGQRYLCCVDGAAELPGSAEYSATLSIGAYDRISLKKTGIDGNCLSLDFVRARSLPDSIPLRVSMPGGWGVENSISVGLCDGPAVGQSIGIQGTVSLSPNGTSCAISAHLTGFFTVAAQGDVLTKRIDADNIPIIGVPPGGPCQ